MNTIRIGSLFFIIMSSHCAWSNQTITPIKIKSDLLRVIDGSFINANIIEMIRRFQWKIGNLLNGDLKPDGKRVGHYEYNKIKMGISELAKISTQENPTVLAALLKKAKADFLELSNEFMHLAHGSKHMMANLIQESCMNHNTPNSLLIIWARAKEEDERSLFDKHITNFAQLEAFCTDLITFFTDFTYSCTTAYKQYEDRVQAFKAIKAMLASTYKGSCDEHAFMGWVKPKLDTLATKPITAHVVKALIGQFYKETNDAKAKP